MIQDSLVPEFKRGEQVVVINKEGKELARGPLLGIAKKPYSTLEFIVGNQKIEVYHGWRTSVYVLSAEKYDHHLRSQSTREYSGVADKFVAYASGSLTDEERARVDELVDELAEIARKAADREYKECRKGGASPKDYQGMWGNKDLSRPEIDEKTRKDILFGLNLNYSEVYDALNSLEQEDSVIFIGSKKPVKQSALKNGTEDK